ncbi:MFS transporter [bacterium]|nr:MAG: MFS transporter [bacterium]
MHTRLSRAALNHAPSPRDDLDPRRWRSLAVVAVAQLMLLLDMTVVNVALTPIQRDLHFTASGLAWVVDGYALPFGGLLLLGGRVADIAGRKRAFLIGLTLFALSSAVGGFASTPAMLISARVVQGIAGALMAPAALALVTILFTERRERATALSVWSGLRGAGVTLGVVLSGGLVALLSWRWVFFINVPIAIAVLILASGLISESRSVEHRRLDALGALLITGGLSLSALGLLEKADHAWSEPWTWLPLSVGVLLTLVFVQVEARTEQPLVPPSFLRSPERAVGNLALAVFSAALAVLFFSMPLYLQQVLRYSPLLTGLAFLPVGPIFALMAAWSPRVVRRLGLHITMAAGLVIVATALLLLAGLHPSGSYALMVLPSLLFFPLGGAMVVVAGTIASVSGTTEENAGLASGVNNVAQQMGMALGLAALVSVGVSRSQALAGQGVAAAQATTGGFVLGFIVTAVVAVAMALLVLGAARHPAYR